MRDLVHFTVILGYDNSNCFEGDKSKITLVPQDDNPFDIATVQQNIIDGLAKDGFTIQQDYVIMVVPNIVDISYGRGVGYTFTEHDLGKEIHEISATQIRAQMREEGKLADKS